MPRKKFIPSTIFPYHVTARCLNKEWFRIPQSEVWDIFSNHLFFLHHAFNIQIHAFTLMSNHFHLLLSTPDGNLDKAMNYFLRETSRLISQRSERINQVFGGPYHWSLLQMPNSYQFAYKYLYRNPVEAGLCKNVEDYRYSTLGALLGKWQTIIPLEPDEYLFANPDTQITWLNTPYPSIEIKEDIRKALFHRKFNFAKGKDRQPHILDMGMV